MIRLIEALGSAQVGETVLDNPPGSLALAALGELLTLRGEFEEAAVHLERARRVTEGRGEMWISPTFAALAALALSRGRPEDARTAIEAATLEDEYPVFVVPMCAC